MTPFGRRSLLSLHCAWLAPVLVVCLGFGSGCAGLNRKIDICPLAIDEQQAELLRVVPLGTPRDLAARRLGEAGIEFTPSSGASPSTFYIDTWQQVDGPAWAMDVALLFDPEGKLYAIRRRNMSRESENVGLSDREMEAKSVDQTTQKQPTRAVGLEPLSTERTPETQPSTRGRGGWQPAGSSDSVSRRSPATDEEPR